MLWTARRPRRRHARTRPASPRHLRVQHGGGTGVRNEKGARVSGATQRQLQHEPSPRCAAPGRGKAPVLNGSAACGVRRAGASKRRRIGHGAGAPRTESGPAMQRPIVKRKKALVSWSADDTEPYLRTTLPANQATPSAVCVCVRVRACACACARVCMCVCECVAPAASGSSNHLCSASGHGARAESAAPESMHTTYRMRNMPVAMDIMPDTRTRWPAYGRWACTWAAHGVSARGRRLSPP